MFTGERINVTEDRAVMHVALRAPRDAGFVVDGVDVVLVVSDDGPGVGDEYLPHLFDRFYRAEDPMRRSGPGSGLGLSIARGIVVAHGGSIGVGDGPGGVVEMALPA